MSGLSTQEHGWAVGWFYTKHSCKPHWWIQSPSGCSFHECLLKSYSGPCLELPTPIHKREQSLIPPPNLSMSIKKQDSHCGGVRDCSLSPYPTLTADLEHGSVLWPWFPHRWPSQPELNCPWDKGIWVQFRRRANLASRLCLFRAAEVLISITTIRTCRPWLTLIS